MKLHEYPAFYGTDARFLQSITRKVEYINEVVNPEVLLSNWEQEATTYAIEMTPERQEILVHYIEEYCQENIDVAFI
ncbi:MAG: hypothetical protein ATN36_04700 [Epulopiscium sp. Nele67-Bin005]|nr:MAG: hypothetical protein ATN36_04700 [Epulopiscium sp. Nele67-Bin005]